MADDRWPYELCSGNDGSVRVHDQWNGPPCPLRRLAPRARRCTVENQEPSTVMTAGVVGHLVTDGVRSGERTPANSPAGVEGRDTHNP